MDSPNDNKAKTNKDIIVYTRRKKGTSSGNNVFRPKEVISSKSKPTATVAKTDGSRKIGEDGSYYDCVLCNDGGDLLCCDACPRTFHLTCLNLESVPEGDWRCPNCSANGVKNKRKSKNLGIKKDKASKKSKGGSSLSVSKGKKASKK